MVCRSSPPVMTVVQRSFIHMAVTAPAWTHWLGPSEGTSAGDEEPYLSVQGSSG